MTSTEGLTAPSILEISVPIQPKLAIPISIQFNKIIPIHQYAATDLTFIYGFFFNF